MCLVPSARITPLDQVTTVLQFVVIFVVPTPWCVNQCRDHIHLLGDVQSDIGFAASRAIGVGVSHPLSMQEVLGSIPKSSMLLATGRSKVLWPSWLSQLANTK